MSRHPRLRTLVIGTTAYWWRIQRQNAHMVILRIWAATRARRDFPLEVRILFDDPWLNFGPIITTSLAQRQDVFQLVPVTPAQVRQMIEAAVQAGWNPQQPANHRQFVWDGMRGLLPIGQTSSNEDPPPS